MLFLQKFDFVNETLIPVTATRWSSADCRVSLTKSNFCKNNIFHVSYMQYYYFIHHNQHVFDSISVNWNINSLLYHR